MLRASLVSRCGNQVAEGFEACDGTAGCSATCRFNASCGNGLLEAPERCDDGNGMSGDGCSSACAIERLEQEPNDTTASVMAAPPVTGWAQGSITAGDVDTWRLVLATAQVVQLETYDGAASGCGIQTTLSLIDAAGVPLLVDDNSGINGCSALTAALPAGTYFVQVRGRMGSTFPEYLLAVRGAGDAGAESEPNELRSMATPLSGTHVVVLGSHAQNVDADVFSLTVPQGRSLRVELIEGGAETCESLGIDGFVTLSTASGLELGWDDDSGRGLCSLIDGTGQVPPHPWARCCRRARTSSPSRRRRSRRWPTTRGGSSTTASSSRFAEPPGFTRRRRRKLREVEKGA